MWTRDSGQGEVDAEGLSRRGSGRVAGAADGEPSPPWRLGTAGTRDREAPSSVGLVRAGHLLWADEGAICHTG